MSLQQELQQFSEQMAANAPAEALQTIGGEIESLVKSGRAEKRCKTRRKGTCFCASQFSWPACFIRGIAGEGSGNPLF